MSTDSISEIFPNEDSWPFFGRAQELDRCLSFLQPDQNHVSSRLLRLRGESGIGKSFFAKELLFRFTQKTPDALAFYINTEESEFESIEFEKRLSVLASFPAQPTRSDPQHVPVNTELTRYLRPLPTWVKVLGTVLSAIKEAAKEVPFVGKPVSSLIPSVFPLSPRHKLAAAGHLLDYLLLSAKKTPVLLILDNFQFLPHSVAMQIDSTLSTSDLGFRFVVVERTIAGQSGAWKLRCFADDCMSVNLAPLTAEETRDLVQTILARNFDELSQIADVIYRKSSGNPKHIWLQLRSFIINQHLATSKPTEKGLLRGIRSDSKDIPDNYEDLIRSLPRLDQLALQLITLLMGGLKVDDVVALLCWITSPLNENEVRKTITDLAFVGLLIINGTQNNRVRIEHELVTSSVRSLTTEDEALELRTATISALSDRLQKSIAEEEYDRLVDRLVGLVAPVEIRQRNDLLAHIISLVSRQYSKENFRYLVWLFETPICIAILDLLPASSLEAFLDSFQKTSHFDKGIAAVELIRSQGKLDSRRLSLAAAKYLVQKFEYGNAEEILATLDTGTDKDLVQYNILLNLCRDEEARSIVDSLPTDASDLDEFQCVMLRNSAHLYESLRAQQLLTLADEGFKILGLRFGEATTKNNMGVLALWSGKRDIARGYFNQARSQLEALDSNEVYQPLSNLAVLHALEGNTTLAKEMLIRAMSVVSPSLGMDDIMLRFNQLIITLLEGSQELATAHLECQELSRRCRNIKDLRFRRIVSWFCSQLESAAAGSRNISILDSSHASPCENETSGLEVFVDIDVGDYLLNGVLFLSPHWRY